MKIELTNGKAEIYTPYNKRFIAAVKKIGAKWNAKCWIVPADRVDDVKKSICEVYGEEPEIIRYSNGIRRPLFQDVEKAWNVLPYMSYNILPSVAQNIRNRAMAEISNSLSSEADYCETEAEKEEMITLYAYAEWIFITKKAQWWNENATNLDPESGADEPFDWIENNESLYSEFMDYVAANGGWAHKL